MSPTSVEALCKHAGRLGLGAVGDITRCFVSSDNNEVVDGGDVVRAFSEEIVNWADDAAMEAVLIENRMVVWLQRMRVCRSTGQ